MNQVNVITQTVHRYECPICNNSYTYEKDAEKCLSKCSQIPTAIETLKGACGKIIKCSHLTKYQKLPHYILCGKVVENSSSPFVDAMDNNDYYYIDTWFLPSTHHVEILSITEAVAEGWRPFSIPMLSRNTEAWNEYVAAMKQIPYEELFLEAIQCITKQNSSWGD